MVGENRGEEEKERRSRKQCGIVSQKDSPNYNEPGAPDTNSGCVQTPSGGSGLRLKGPLQICRYRDHGNFWRQTGAEKDCRWCLEADRGSEDEVKSSVTPERDGRATVSSFLSTLD